MHKILWVGDAVVASGFARCTHKILEPLCGDNEVQVLGIGHNGDPVDPPYPYPIYPSFLGGDVFGVGRIAGRVAAFEPDVIILQNDPWNIPPYIEQLEDDHVPIVGAIAVDGLNCKGASLNGLSHAIFWTKFAQAEATYGGLTVPSTVIPLGVDLSIYGPGDRSAARSVLDLSGNGPTNLNDVFIVGNVNRNQPRKRLDLTIAYFAEWIKTHRVTDAFLYLHVCPTGEHGCDIRQLVDYYGIRSRVLLSQPHIGYGIPEDLLVQTYRTFDVQLTTTQGEGFGLSTLEGMACGIPQIVPSWAALGDWPGEAAYSVPCASTAITPNGVNVIGGVPARVETVEALDTLYRDSTARFALRSAGLALTAQPQFRWSSIAEAYANVFSDVIQSAKESELLTK
jgi:glycosyltransferase involved in cell wall biosynthesis